MATYQTILSQIGAVASLFSGPFMQLGSFSFADYEVPEKISWGGKQQTVVHQYPGGGRIIDIMGRSDKEICWSGILLGSNAANRAQQLDKIRTLGKPVILSWGSIRVNVVVESIEFEEKYHQIQYTITCIPTQVALAASTSTSLLGKITQDVGNALGINISGALSTVQTAIQKIQPLASVATTLTGGSPAALNVLGAVNNASSVAGNISSIANGTIGGFSNSPSPFSSLNPLGAVSSLNSLGSAISSASSLSAIGPYLSRMASNLTNPSS